MNNERKYFLDWLRVAAFGCLILFHVGMLYVSWDYNIKSPRLYPDLEFAMLAVSPWRLVLLFFIAGVASRCLLEKVGAGGFAADRLRRLLLVLLVGIFAINPLQVYVEFLHKGYIESGYLDFWLNTYLPGAEFPNRSLPTWDHLWFLLYLLVYSLGLDLVFTLTARRKTTLIPLSMLIVIPALWLSLTTILIDAFSPVTQDFTNDWANHLRWIGVFVTGVLCARRAEFWTRLVELRRHLLLASLVGLALQIANALWYRTGTADPFWDGLVYGFVQGCYGWSVVLMLAGYAAHYLNKNNPALRYLSDAVLPVYVVHQPILLASAWLLFPLMLPVAVEALLIVMATAFGSFAVYELCIRRWSVARLLFGLRTRLPAAAMPLPKGIHS